MQINEVMNGFRLREIREVPEAKGTLYRMIHEKSGADLVYLDRNDTNKTFAIAFRTIPQDDTGVFHILEHSVLCGSEKYPTKEPFVDLIKSSLNTFLNAFTFPDKTMYPVCSKNERDFLNLIDVYLDAVFHPLSLTDPHAFRQEGWHYELESPQGELTMNGVVYNEMKGDYASPDTVLSAALNRALFPDTCYGFESGGHPEHIPELTYEGYLASHARYYHPSNARIFLDGTMDLGAVLGKIDAVLKDYDRIDPDSGIAFQQPVRAEDTTELYEIGLEEDPENKVILAEGWVFGDYTQRERTMAAAILSEILCGSNEAPLTAALLSKGLCEDAAMGSYDGILQNYLSLTVRNTSEDRIGEVWQTVDEVLRGLAENGIDRKHLHSQLSHLEFVTREKDFGRMPKGLVYGLSAMETWLYGGDPAEAFCFEEVFRTLEKGIDEGYFEKFLSELVLDSRHKARVILLPSATLGEQKRKREKERLAEVKAGWTNEEKNRVIREFEDLRERQGREDTPEARAKIPRLALSDIPESDVDLNLEIRREAGRDVMYHAGDTDGIDYLELYFAVDDLTAEEFQDAAYFASIVGQVPTEHYSLLDLESEIDARLGRFGLKLSIFSDAKDTEHSRKYIAACVSVLDSKKYETGPLLDEILNKSRFYDRELMFNLLRQARIGLEQGITMSGDRFAAIRTQACFSARGAANEYANGIEMLRWLQREEKDFEADPDAFCARMSALRRLFSRERLTVGLTADSYDGEWLSSVISVLGAEPAGERREIAPLEKKREGFVIAADIGFAVRSAMLPGAYTGSRNVAANIATYGYLWNTIRVQGGAYGTGLRFTTDGDASFTSFRDPVPAQSLHAYAGTGESIREICGSGESIDDYIISTLAEPVTTARAEGVAAATYYLSGVDLSERAKRRAQVLATTREELVRISYEIDRLAASDSICVVGGKAVIDACADELDSVEQIQS